MRKFIFGFVSGIVLLLLAAFLYIRFGFVDPRADIPVNVIEMHVAMPALDASVDRRAPEIKDPVAATDENLLAGMQIYQSDCASCHGDVYHPHASLAETLYPRPPQFVEDAPDMPENQNYYIIRHGVRLSGMPGWKYALSDDQMWQVTTFLSHMDHLPAQVAAAWKTKAAGQP